MELIIKNNNEVNLQLLIAPKSESIKFTDFLADCGIKIGELVINYACDQSTLILPKKHQNNLLQNLDCLIKAYRKYGN